MKLSQRGLIPPFIVMDVMRAANARQAAQGDVLHLEVGQPATPAPQAVLAAAQRALGCDRLGYTDALGLPALREAIAGWYRHRYGLAVPPERIVVTTGSSGGFLLSFLAAFDPGDRVALVAPGYPAYRNILKAVDCEPVDLPAGPENRFQIEAAMLDRLQQAVQGLIIASPSNPTGTMLATAELAALAQWCRQRGVWLVSDEIYHGISYIGPAQTALAVSDDVIVVNSFSKYFSMTGWRLGWIVVPPAMVRAVECLAQNLFISPPTLSQLAALAVFDCEPELDANVACYARNRELLLEQLPKAGFDRLAPADGAFYIYADIAALSDDSRALARRLLDETGVAVTPGVDFDPIRGHRYLRFSFAGATADMAEAARRLIAWRSR